MDAAQLCAISAAWPIIERLTEEIEIPLESMDSGGLFLMQVAIEDEVSSHLFSED